MGTIQENVNARTQSLHTFPITQGINLTMFLTVGFNTPSHAVRWTWAIAVQFQFRSG